MGDVAERYRSLAAGFTARVQAVPSDRWANPSPCEEWTARDVVRHVVAGAGQFLGMVGRSLPPAPSADDDPVAAWASARDAVQEGLDDPAVAGLEYEGEMGPSTLEQAIDRFYAPDLLVHSWDLARAAGLDEHLDPGAVHRVFEAMKPVDELLRLSGVFGPRLDPPPGADEQAQLLAFLGRRV